MPRAPWDLNITDVWNILHTFLSSKLHIAELETQNVHRHIYVGIKSSEQA